MALVVGLITTLSFAFGERDARQAALRLAYRTGVDSAASDLANQDVESARLRLAEVPAELRGWEWRHLALRVDREVRQSDGEVVSHDVRYFITSLDPLQGTAAELLQYVRDHWKVENGLTPASGE